MRILHVSPSLDPAFGGPVMALLGLANAQANLGMQISILATNKSSTTPVAEQLKEKGIAVHILSPGFGPLLWHPKLAFLVQQLIPDNDLIHIHTVWEEIQHRTAVTAFRQHKPYILRPCGMLDPWSLKQSRLKKAIYMFARLRRTLNRATAVHYTTDAERDLAAPLKIQSRAVVQPNGVDLEISEKGQRLAFRRKHGFTSQTEIVLFCGRVHPKKGLELLLQAFAWAKRPLAKLVVAGPVKPEYKAKLVSLTESLGIRDCVLFTGMLTGDERAHAFADADIFVLPSYQENFANSVVEALSCGVPVIISKAVNIHGSIVAAGVGSIAELDPQSIADQICYWLSRPELLSGTRQRASIFAVENYNWAHIALRWSELYKSFIERSGS